MKCAVPSIRLGAYQEGVSFLRNAGIEVSTLLNSSDATHVPSEWVSSKAVVEMEWDRFSTMLIENAIIDIDPDDFALCAMVFPDLEKYDENDKAGG